MANNAKHPQVPLLLTRPVDSGRAFFDALPSETAALVSPLETPLIEIVRSNTLAPDMDAAIITSSNVLPFAGAGRGRKAYCVGAATTAKAQHRGWDAQNMGLTADALVSALIATPPSEELVHLSGEHTRGHIAQRLNHSGLKVDHAILYTQRLLLLSSEAAALLEREISVIVPLFSPRSAAQFAACVQNSTRANLYVLALSPAVAAEIRHVKSSMLHVCAAPEQTAMVELVKNVAEHLTLG